MPDWQNRWLPKVKRKALKVLDYCMEMIPVEKVPHDMFIPDIIEAYYEAGGGEKAIALSKSFTSYNFNRLDYYFKQTQNFLLSADYEIQLSLQSLSRVATAAKDNGFADFAKEVEDKLESYYRNYVRLLQPEIK